MYKYILSLLVAASIVTVSTAQITPKAKKLTKKEVKGVAIKSTTPTVKGVAVKSTVPVVKATGTNGVTALPVKSTPIATPAMNPATAVKPTMDATSAGFDSGISFEKEIHDYGTIEQDADGNCEFKFYNKGTEPIVISNAVGSCGCTVPTPPKEPIAPGQSNVIKVKYDTHNKIGAINKQITVTIKSAVDPAKVQTKILKITGNVLKKPQEPSLEKPAQGPMEK